MDIFQVEGESMFQKERMAKGKGCERASVFGNWGGEHGEGREERWPMKSRPHMWVFALPTLSALLQDRCSFSLVSFFFFF